MKPTSVSRQFLNLLIASLRAGSFSASAAQTVVNTGTVRGVVSDKSGAVVPEAAVVLLSRGTGQHQTRTTNDAGSAPSSLHRRDLRIRLRIPSVIGFSA
jgi:hypothetical protein